MNKVICFNLALHIILFLFVCLRRIRWIYISIVEFVNIVLSFAKCLLFSHYFSCLPLFLLFLFFSLNVFSPTKVDHNLLKVMAMKLLMHKEPDILFICGKIVCVDLTVCTFIAHVLFVVSSFFLLLVLCVEMNCTDFKRSERTSVVHCKCFQAEQ